MWLTPIQSNVVASRSPEAVEVAVRVYRFDLVALADAEAYLGLVAGMKRLSLISLLRFQAHPFYVVFSGHGMIDRADTDLDVASVDLEYGNVLFRGSVDRSGDYLFHGLAAAHDRRARLFNDGDYLSARLTAVKSQIHFLFFLSF